MTLSDKMAYRQIVGGLMQNPSLFLIYPDMNPMDFDQKVARICFITIKNLFEQGAIQLSPVEVDQEIEKHENSFIIYKNEDGLNFLKTAYQFAEVNNFELYYKRLKKYALLRRLQKDKYDISEYYLDDKEIDNPLKETELQQHLDESSLEDILNSVENKYNIIRNEFLHGGKLNGDPAEGIFTLIDNLQKKPSIGPSLEGQIFSTVCRGARDGCFYLKSASTACGKSRTSVFDACRIAYPERWSHTENTFIREFTAEGYPRQARKVLFIVTEMDKEELQTIILAYISGVDEDHILTGQYELGEYTRVKHAGAIMNKYSGYFFIEEISEPDLVNIEATIKKHVTLNNIKYCFYDYIHTTANLVGQFAKTGLREDVCLMLLANQLKQIAKDYNIFVFSATQVNANAMSDDGEFKNESCIRGAKSVSDKCDVGFVMTRVTDKIWNSVLANLKSAVREGIIDESYINDDTKRPTHILDIYKMRRGRYKNVRIWSYIHLGTGERYDLFITTANNQPIQGSFDLYATAKEQPLLDWESEK